MDDTGYALLALIFGAAGTAFFIQQHRRLCFLCALFGIISLIGMLVN